jgi:hypothetical protein
MLRRLFTVSIAAAALAAGEAGLLAEAQLVLRVNDPAWVERTVNQLGSAREATGRDLRAWLARSIHRSRSLDALDPARPAVFAWRSGRLPLLAILPVRDRLAFLDDFGVGPEGQAPLIRVGDNDGTAVLRQNRLAHDGGMAEYRLLVTNSAAHLAPTVAECRALSALGARGAVAEGALELSGLGEALVPAARTIPLLGDQAPAVLAQVRRWSLSIASASETVLRMRGTLVAEPESALARWIAAQRNQAGRLGPQVRSGSESLLLSLSLTWLGQAERWLLEQAPVLRARVGAAWTPAVDESWRLLAGLVERSGGAALAFDGTATLAAVEHPRAGEALTLLAVLGEALGAAPRQDQPIAGRPALQRLHQVLLAGERHLLAVEGVDAVARAAGLLARLDRPQPPEGAPAIAEAWFDAGRFEPVPDGGEQQQRPGRVALRVAGPERLELDAEIPLAVLMPLAERFGLLPPPVVPPRGR